MSDLIYGLIVTLFGVTIVFLVLVALWGILTMMKSLFGEKKKQDNNQVIIQKELTPDVTNIARADSENEELIAVIMAAINASMGTKSNLIIRSISRIGDNTPIWGQTGRNEQMLNRF